jgi:SNF2 family DNA or RNA helicase
MRGEVFIAADDRGLILRPASKADRVSITTEIRRLAEGARIAIDGSDLILSTLVAVTLLHEKSRFCLDWSPEAKAFIDNFSAGVALRTHALKRLRKLQQTEAAEWALRDYDQREILDPHQKIAVAAMTDVLIDGLCLFDEQGSGKTVMTIHAFDRMVKQGRVTKLLIFAPKNMLPTWKDDFAKFMGGKYRVEIVAGGRKSKFEMLMTQADVYVTNYETAQNLEGPLRSLLQRFSDRVIMAVDESFFVKNATAHRSAAIRRLRSFCKRCWMLCGTPAPNGAIDVVHQFDVADGGVTFASIDLPKDPIALRQRVQTVVEARGLYLRRLKNEVLPELAPKSFERVSIDMEPIQRGLYAETLTGLIDDVVAADERGFRDLWGSFLARRMALLQIASNPKLVFPDYEQIPPKQEALERLLNELITIRGEKVVLWSYFRGTLDQLEHRFSKYGAVRLDGSVTDMTKRGDAVRSFQQDPTTRLFIANPAAAGAGITLTAARIAVYESFPMQTAHFLQSIDRIHRRGQTRAAHYYFLLSTGSLDEVEYERLIAKDKMGFLLFGDEPPEMHTREFFLRDLNMALERLG